MSDMEGVISRNNACDVIQNVVSSHKIIKYGCDALYRLYDIIHIVGVLSYL